MILAIIVLIIIILFLVNYAFSGVKLSRFLKRGRRIDGQYHSSKLVGVLLGLDERSVNELLELYKKEFGRGPARYAKSTYQNWKTGKVQPSIQTYRRFLVHLPDVMSYDLKCEVLRHFMLEYAAKDKYELNIHLDDWEEKLKPLVQQIVDKAYTVQLPDEVERKLKWLGGGDMKAAQRILRASQAEESRIAVSGLREEFDNIEKLLSAEGLKPKVHHTLEFPYGTIELNIKRR